MHLSYGDFLKPVLRSTLWLAIVQRLLFIIHSNHPLYNGPPLVQLCQLSVLFFLPRKKNFLNYHKSHGQNWSKQISNNNSNNSSHHFMPSINYPFETVRLNSTLTGRPMCRHGCNGHFSNTCCNIWKILCWPSERVSGVSLDLLWLFSSLLRGCRRHGRRRRRTCANRSNFAH